MSFNIAIDGPAGAGKSTVARRAAGKLGFIYVDTGAMYRTIALYMLRGQVNIDMFLNGEDVSSLIRTPEVSATASLTSAKAAVRAKLTDLQKDLAARENVLMDGRDIGTCILPDAQLKIFLTASVDERARRRYLELKEKGEDCDLAAIREEIALRDYRDSHRESAPLKQAEDAVLLDTSDMDADEAVKRVVELAEERMRACGLADS